MHPHLLSNATAKFGKICWVRASWVNLKTNGLVDRIHHQYHEVLSLLYTVESRQDRGTVYVLDSKNLDQANLHLRILQSPSPHTYFIIITFSRRKVYLVLWWSKRLLLLFQEPMPWITFISIPTFFFHAVTVAASNYWLSFGCPFSLESKLTSQIPIHTAPQWAMTNRTRPHNASLYALFFDACGNYL
jgi:hypothetical protein